MVFFGETESQKADRLNKEADEARKERERENREADDAMKQRKRSVRESGS